VIVFSTIRKGGQNHQNLYEEKFDVVVTTEVMYPRLRHLQLQLKAKMPNPRTGVCVCAVFVRGVAYQVRLGELNVPCE